MFELRIAREQHTVTAREQHTVIAREQHTVLIDRLKPGHLFLDKVYPDTPSVVPSQDFIMKDVTVLWS
ncbi:hypothetical protein NPIL_594311 [Nephila pilipes]|uniref:Uncharacterized protein n=1 Tax=Nephila pilipes TaxID=299642 RepID=A0A8X6PI62_NEPPI|nr:hypothetical protein NPIL_594311 [Nephila pilipes]